MEPIDQMLRVMKPEVLRWISSWHGNQAWLLPFGNQDSVSGGLTSTTTAVFSATAPGIAYTVVSWTQALYVATTNNTSNYWTLQLYRYISGGTYPKIGEISTNRSSAGAWTKLSVTIGQAGSSTDLQLYIKALKTGSPGALTLAGPLVWVR